MNKTQNDDAKFEQIKQDFIQKNNKIFQMDQQLDQQLDQILDLYIRYDNVWNKFIIDDSNKHLLIALNTFVNSNIQDNNINVKKYPTINPKYNDIYTITDIDKKQIQFMISYDSQIGFINRILDY
jgi:hypothetical protein